MLEKIEDPESLSNFPKVTQPSGADCHTVPVGIKSLCVSRELLALGFRSVLESLMMFSAGIHDFASV